MKTKVVAKPQPDFVEPARAAVRGGVGRRSGPPVAQAKLEVGPVNDPYERQADAVADAVMRHFATGSADARIDGDGAHGVARTPISRIAASGAATQNLLDEHRPDDIARSPIAKVARSATPSIAAGAQGGELEAPIASRIQSALGGRALDDQTRGRFESAMGTDLGPVRIHADSELAPQIGAHAFTHGTDVHFAPGAYDPGSESGQRLLAHELTHVMQQTGSAQRVQAKLWTAKEFKTNTAIKSRMIGPSDASTAQDVILSLLAQYEKFMKKGFKSADAGQAAQAVSQVRAMQDVAQRWLDQRGEMYADPTNYTLATLDQAKETYKAKQADPQAEDARAIGPMPANPKAERMAGLQQFVQLCKTEIDLLSASLSPEQLADAKIDETNKQYKKAKERYPDEKDAKSAFGKIGRLVDMAVGTPGSSVALEVTADILVQPGVYVTFGVKGGAERGTGGDEVKLRFDVNVGVKGKVSGAAELSATLGGFIEAQAKSGVEAATLMSYALYRRGREGSAPTSLISLLWGGSSGQSGLAKSEAWSRQLEKQVWGGDDESANNSYVQSGGQVGVGASLGVEGGPISGELEGGAFAGRRVDKQSLMDRKGGAGAQNVESDSIFNAGERQKRVGADVFGWNLGGKISVAGFTVGLSISQQGYRRGGGASVQDEASKAKTVTWDQVSIEAKGSGKMPPGLDIGAKIYQLLEKMVREAEKAEQANGDPDAAAGKALLKTLAMTTPSVLTPKGGIQVPEAADLTIGATIKAGGSDKTKSPVLEVAVGTEKETSLPIPDILKVKLTKSQAFFTWSSEDGPWVLGE